MKAILLAAGLGTRLRPITNTIPKCLVPIAGKPLLMYWLEALSKVGVTEFHINTHYLADKVTGFIEQLPSQYKVITYHEPELLGTLGSLSNMINDSDFNQGSVLVAHADNLVFCDWQDFLQSHQSRPNAIGTMMTFDTDVPSSCGIVETDQEQCLMGFHEKVENPPSNHASGAIFLFNQALIKYLAEKDESETDISLHLMPKLIGKMYCWHNDNYLRDIGSPEALKQANNDVIRYE